MEQNKDLSDFVDVQGIVRQAVLEYLRQDTTQPAYKAELQEERKRREQLERRVNELVEENRRSRLVNEAHSTRVPVSNGIDIEKIGPGMSREDLERARQEILRVATQTARAY